jgi:DNA end-binding protein Ku
MPRAVWSGTLSFGLVTIPVRLYPATEPKDVRFHLMDQRGRRVRYRRFVDREPAPEVEDAPGPPQPDTERFEPRAAEDRGEQGVRPPGAARPADEEEIEYGELMRGFETDDGRVVLLSHDEIEQVRPEPSHSIDIEAFVELRDIDPVSFEKSYVMAPQRGAEKPYVLLLRAIERSGRVGIGRFILRTKPHLVAVRPRDGAIGLETLFFGDEVRDPRSLVPGIDGVDVSERELELAQTLIKTLETGWDPAAYADTYRVELLKKIAEKTPVEREEDRELEAEAPSRRAEELMDALMASVEAAKKAKRRPSRRRPA